MNNIAYTVVEAIPNDGFYLISGIDKHKPCWLAIGRVGYRGDFWSHHITSALRFSTKEVALHFLNEHVPWSLQHQVKDIKILHVGLTNGDPHLIREPKQMLRSFWLVKVPGDPTHWINDVGALTNDRKQAQKFAQLDQAKAAAAKHLVQSKPKFVHVTTIKKKQSQLAIVAQWRVFADTVDPDVLTIEGLDTSNNCMFRCLTSREAIKPFFTFMG